MRRSRPRIAEPCRRTSSPKASRPPVTARETKSRSWVEPREFGDSAMTIAPCRLPPRSDPGRAAAGGPEHQVGEPDQPGDRARSGDAAAGHVGGDVVDAHQAVPQAITQAAK